MLHRVEVPLVENGFDLGLAALVDDHEHALLALAEQNLKRLHVGLALGHEVQIGCPYRRRRRRSSRRWSR